MKYITRGERGWDHRPYWRYLENVKQFMPLNLFLFAYNQEHHDLTHPNSLHNAWLERWCVTEAPDGDPKKGRSLSVEVTLLGPKRDRRIHLAYQGVTSHTIQTPEQIAPAYSLDQAHGDLIVHETTIARDGIYLHEILFSSNAVFTVQFAGFEHRIERV